MRIRDLDEGAWDSFQKGFSKGLNKPSLGLGKREPPLARLDPRALKKVLKSILRGEQLDQTQLDYLQSIYKQI